ncbi:hypothetical protein ACFLYF_02305 [Chloroflexota bacterium]
MVLKCQRCGKEISPDDSYSHVGMELCEDCYLDMRQSVKGCDPWAVYLAGRTREKAGVSDADGLTDLQKQICEMVRRRGKVAPEEVMAHFGLSPAELQAQVAVLRHCELVRGQKEGVRVYLAPFGE